MNTLLTLVCFACIAKVFVNGVTVTLQKPIIPGNKNYVEEGEEVKFICEHRSEVDTSSSTLQFTHRGKSVDFDGQRRSVGTSVNNARDMSLTVTIKNAVFDDAGKYTCTDTPSSKEYHLELFVYRVTREDVMVGENATTAELRCTIENSPRNNNYQNEQPKRVEWFKFSNADGNFTKVEESETISVSDLHDSLNISKIDYTTYEAVGEYLCEIQPDTGARVINYTVNVNAAAGAVAFMSESTKGIQGDPKEIHCLPYGFPKPQVKWTLDGAPLNYGERVSAEPGIDNVGNSTLVFNPLEEEDGGNYTCHVTNSLGSGEKSIILRVKDRYAALWPFLGICAEVAILCAIIFFFEKRRARKMREEEEDPAAGDGLINHREEELRQRKVQA